MIACVIYALPSLSFNPHLEKENWVSVHWQSLLFQICHIWYKLFLFLHWAGCCSSNALHMYTQFLLLQVVTFMVRVHKQNFIIWIISCRHDVIIGSYILKLPIIYIYIYVLEMKYTSIRKNVWIDPIIKKTVATNWSCWNEVSETCNRLLKNRPKEEWRH
jgi:hypothetical protein